jgi:nucleotide-binding universal stress UspA family protein
MYTKILAAVDGSSIAMRALQEAIQLAKTQDAALMTVYVIEYPHNYIADLGYDPAPVTEALVSEGTQILQQVEGLMKSEHIACSSRLVDNRHSLNSIAEQLQQVAAEYEADLVVLGTHGRGGFKRLLLGSVAEAFVRLSDRPVLLVPGKPYKEEAQQALIN